MNIRVIKRIMITFCLMVLVAFFAYRFYKSEKSSMESVYDDIFLGDPHTTPPKPNPNFMRDYPENRTGSFQFNPSTILESLDQGKDVFTVEDADAVETEYDGIGWTQSDFLRVANALSQKVWHEPLDMNGWMVYNIIFSGGCHDNIAKLNLFDITYYKTIKTGWQMDGIYGAFDNNIPTDGSSRLGRGRYFFYPLCVRLGKY